MQTTNFRTSHSVEEIFGPKFEPDPPKKVRGGWRLVQSMFVGTIAGVVVCAALESGVWFLPVFGVITLVGWVAGLGEGK